MDEYIKVNRADWSANNLGIIGDSKDKRFTIIRTDRKINDPSPPEEFFIMDWHKAQDLLNMGSLMFWMNKLPKVKERDYMEAYLLGLYR